MANVDELVQDLISQLPEERVVTSLEALISEGFPQSFVDAYNDLLAKSNGGAVIIHRDPATPKLVGFSVAMASLKNARK
jgi:hypothetical protein